MENEAGRDSTLSDWRQANVRDKAKIAKEMAKLAHSRFKETCTGKVLRVANYAAVGILGLGWILRWVYMFTGEAKSPEYSGFWFFCATMFYAFFLALLGLSLHPDEGNKFGLLVRVHFRALDFDFGRGVFIFFLAM